MALRMSHRGTRTMVQCEGGRPQRHRESFNSVAALYNRYRRGYPPAVVDAVLGVAGIGPGSRVLEIGPGTGQLTWHLLQRGAAVTGVELGPELAALAQQNLAGFPDFEMFVSSFEDWPLPARPFDVVVAATAFHWVDEAVRTTKAARALGPTGVLVAIYPHQVMTSDGGFFEASQRCYLQWGLSTDPDWRAPHPHELGDTYPDIDACPAFTAVTRHRIPCPQRFTTAEYVGLLRTDSLVLTLPEPDRPGFLADMRTLIDSEFGGMVRRGFVYEVVTAMKRPHQDGP